MGRGRSGFLAARAGAEAKALNLETGNPLAGTCGLASAAYKRLKQSAHVDWGMNLSPARRNLSAIR